jgi:hypothetical protein
VGDEVQFVTQSAGATKAANLILGLAGLGPPFAYACNFSLLHRFLKRPQEQRERLISNAFILLPEAVDGPDWMNHIDAVLAVDPAFAELRARQDIAFYFHCYAFGNKRNARRLAVLSYGAARKRGSNVVSLIDLQTAYLSFEFSNSRRDVEILSGKVGKIEKHEDLWCPLEAATPLASGRRRREEKEIREKEEARAALEASLTADERSNLADAKEACGVLGKPEKPKRPKATAGALLAGATAYANRKKGRGEAA